MGTTVFATVSTPGPPGPTGPAGYSPVYIVAAGAPSNAIGNNGDMYINSSNGDVYGPKAAGAWGPVAVNIKGPTGATGATGAPGYSPLYIVAAGAPTGAVGNNGDMYINSTTSDVYGPKTSGAWGGIVCNIKGSTGAQGPPGVGYTPKGAWDNVTTYAQGDQVTRNSQLYISLQSGNLNHDPATSPTYWQPVGSGANQTPWLSNIDAATFTLNNAGKIGIGVTSPTAYLQINSSKATATYADATIRLQRATGASFVGIAFAAANAANAIIHCPISSDDLAFGWESGSGMVERMRIMQTGNVGIGTAGPGYMLEVAGQARFYQVLVRPSAGNGLIQIQDGVPSSTSKLELDTTSFRISSNALPVVLNANTNGGNTNQLYLASSGNVGIGTASPTSLLQVHSPSIAADTVVLNLETQAYSAQNVAQQIRFGDTAGSYHLAHIGAGFHTATGGYLAFRTSSAGTTHAERMRIDNNGNVGIATTSPNSAFNVVGAISVNAGPGNPTHYRIESLSDQTVLNIGYWASGAWFGAVNPALRLNYTGQVGIGKTASASYALDVAGDCNITGAYRVNGVAISGGGGVTTQSNVTGGRVLGSVYQNTTGKPMFVSVAATFNPGGGTLTGYTDTISNPSLLVAGNTSPAGGQQTGVGFWVLNNNYYKVGNTTGATLTTWIEWT